MSKPRVTGGFLVLVAAAAVLILASAREYQQASEDLTIYLIVMPFAIAADALIGMTLLRWWRGRRSSPNASVPAKRSR